MCLVQMRIQIQRRLTNLPTRPAAVLPRMGYSIALRSNTRWRDSNPNVFVFTRKLNKASGHTMEYSTSLILGKKKTRVERFSNSSLSRWKERRTFLSQFRPAQNHVESYRRGSRWKCGDETVASVPNAGPKMTCTSTTLYHGRGVGLRKLQITSSFCAANTIWRNTTESSECQAIVFALRIARLRFCHCS